jgi:type III pantothenate kinase
MLLTVDIGNTNIGFGLFEGATLACQFRCESARQRTSDEYAVLLRQMLALRDIDPKKVDASIIASVVPPLTDAIVDAVRKAFARDPLVVGPKTRSGMAILYETPREVGTDRIVNAVAAYDQVKAGVIVVDFGTATTFDCVTEKGEYIGGVIAPGIMISAEALFSRAAKLHPVDIAKPARVVGRNPMQSMQSGIVFGYAGLVDGVVARIKAELGYPCAVIGTGGLARLIAPETASIERVDEVLTLHGLRLIYERNVES